MASEVREKKTLRSLLKRLAVTGGSIRTEEASRKSAPASIYSRNSSDVSLSSKSSLRSRLGRSNYGKRVDTLGSGISGNVGLYYKKESNEFFAVKTFNERENSETKEEYRERCFHEYDIVRSLTSEHVNILKSYSFTSGILSHQLIMEFSPYPLLKVIRLTSPSEEEVMCFFKQVCEGIRFLHQNHIAHRDLKMENLLLDECGNVKIIDFGSAFVFSTEKRKAVGIVGTETLISPEALKSVSYDSESNDVWSLGILLYSMLNLGFPWKSARESDQDYMDYQSNVTVLKSKFPDEHWSIVSKILDIDPLKRIDVTSLCDELTKAGVCDHSVCPTSRHSKTLRMCANHFKYGTDNI